MKKLISAVLVFTFAFGVFSPSTPINKKPIVIQCVPGGGGGGGNCTG